MKNRLRSRYNLITEELKKYERRDRNDWEEGYYHGVLEEHEFLWLILEWYKVDLDEVIDG